MTTIFEWITGVGAWRRSASPIGLITRRCAARALSTWLPAGILALGLSCGDAREACPQWAEAQVAEEDGDSVAAPQGSSQEPGTQVVSVEASQVVKVEIQRQLNELWRDQLEERGKRIDRGLVVIGLVLTFFGIVIAVAGFFAFGRFREIEKDARANAAKIEGFRKRSKDGADEIDARLQGVRVLSPKPPTSDNAIDASDNAIDDALALQRKGKNEKAIQRWHAIAGEAEGQNDERAAIAWFYIAGLRKAGELGRAIADYDKAIELKRDFAEAYSNRGGAKGEQRLFEEAIADYDKAIECNPKLGQAYFGRGVVNHLLEQHREAQADFDEAIKCNLDLVHGLSGQLSRYRKG